MYPALARVVLLRWSGSVGLTPRSLLTALLTGTAALSSVGVLVAGNLRVEESGQRADVWLFAVALVGFVVASGVGIVGSHWAEQVYADLRFLRVMPVGRHTTSWVTRLPVGVLGLCLTATVLPAGSLLVRRIAGYGTTHAVASTVLLLMIGTSFGWLGHWATGWVLKGRAARSMRLSLTLTGWLAMTIAGLVVFTAGIRSGGGGYAPLIRLTLLGWPAVLWLLLSASPLAYLTCGVLAAGASALTVVALPRIPVARGDRIWVPFRATGRAMPARLLMRRILRNGRALEWVLMGGLAAVAAGAFGLYAQARLPIRYDLSLVFSMSAGVAMSFSCLVRGLSARTRPLERRIGLTPREHVTAAVAASLAVGCLVMAPVVIAVLASDRRAVVGQVLVAAVTYGVLGVAVSFLLAPSLGAGGGEMSAFVVYIVAGLVVAAAAENMRGALGEPASAVGQLVLCLIALWLATVAETRRRRPA